MVLIEIKTNKLDCFTVFQMNFSRDFAATGSLIIPGFLPALSLGCGIFRQFLGAYCCESFLSWVKNFRAEELCNKQLKSKNISEKANFWRLKLMLAFRRAISSCYFLLLLQIFHFLPN